MSGNPFRRNAPGNVKLTAEETKVERTPSPFKIGKKEKRVKIQTPPQSPEEIPRRLSAGRSSPPPPEKTESSDEEDSDTTATADEDIEQAVRNTRRNSGSLAPGGGMGEQIPSGAQSPATAPPAGGGSGAPSNPFARTLASKEAAFGLQRASDGQDESAQSKREGGAKKGMDVDMFKNILMTGSPAPTPPQQQSHQQQVQDSSSNTDTSSLSKHSLFDQNYNIHPESPRSSFDHVDYSDEEDEADDEKGGLMGGKKERLDDFAPPAPPKPGQERRAPARGPQTVSFADFDNVSPTEERASSPAQAQVTPANAATANKNRPPMLHRTASDLNKPLPKTPPRSPGLPQEQPVSMDSQVSQTPQPPTPTVTSPDETTKKAPPPPPPPPPTSRRAGQGGSSHTRARSTSDTTKESGEKQAKGQESAGQKSGAPPPPPPSRKSKPASHAASPAVSTPVTETAPSTQPPAPSSEPEAKSPAPPPPPAPAPRRNPSTKIGSSVQRSPSNASHNSIPRSEHSHSHHSAPPAPPPRRAAGSKRESLDGAPGSAHSNANSVAWAQQRRSSKDSFESARSGSLSNRGVSVGSEQEATAVGDAGQPKEGSVPQSDILADMTAFQAEIDALRKQAEGGSGGGGGGGG